MLETTGRRTGLARRTPVVSRLDDDTVWLVAEYGRRAAYVRNLEADARVRVKVRGRWRRGTAHPLPGDDPRPPAAHAPAAAEPRGALVRRRPADRPHRPLTEQGGTLMTSTATADIATIEALAARYGEAWNSQDLDAIVAMHAEDGTFQLHVPGGELVSGREAIRAAFAGFLAQLPDINFEPRRLRVGPGFRVLESTMTGTAAAPFDVDGGRGRSGRGEDGGRRRRRHLGVRRAGAVEGHLSRRAVVRAPAGGALVSLVATTPSDQLGEAAEAFCWRVHPGLADARRPWEEASTHFRPMVAPDVRMIQPQLPNAVGHDAFRRQFIGPLFTMLPDVHAEVEDWARAGDIGCSSPSP